MELDWFEARFPGLLSRVKDFSDAHDDATDVDHKAFVQRHFKRLAGKRALVCLVGAVVLRVDAWTQVSYTLTMLGPHCSVRCS